MHSAPSYPKPLTATSYPGSGLVLQFPNSRYTPIDRAISGVVQGWIFILLAVTGARGKLIQMVPRSVMLATSAGIGLFLAHIGLQSSEGLGVIQFDGAT